MPLEKRAVLHQLISFKIRERMHSPAARRCGRAGVPRVEPRRQMRTTMTTTLSLSWT